MLPRLYPVIVILAGLFLAPIVCQGESQYIQLVTSEYPPFVSKQLEGYGCITHLITDVLQEIGIKPDYRFYPWQRCERSVERGDVWATFPYAYTEQRAERFWFSEPLIQYTSKFFYYKEPPVENFETLTDLTSYRIGGVLGYFYEEMFEAAGLQVEYAPTEKSALNMLMAGRVDMVPLNEVFGWYLIRGTVPDQAKHFGTLETPLNRAGLFLMVSKSYPYSVTLLKQFNIALLTIIARPKYQDLLQECSNLGGKRINEEETHVE